MVAPALEIDDIVVLLLGAPSKSPRLQDRVQGITRLEKLIFLLEQESDLGQELKVSADFIAHNFGPFSSEIYKAVDLLSAANLIVDSGSLSRNDDDSWERENLIYNDEDVPDRYATRDFSLTGRGRRYYESLIRDLPEGTDRRIGDFKQRFGTIPLRQLIRYVYEKPEYQAYIANSKIKRDVLGR